MKCPDCTKGKMEVVINDNRPATFTCQHCGYELPVGGNNVITLEVK